MDGLFDSHTCSIYMFNHPRSTTLVVMELMLQLDTGTSDSISKFC